MSKSPTTAIPKTNKAAPTIQPPVPDVQRSPEKEADISSTVGQRAVNAVGGGSMQVLPTRLGALLEQMEGATARQRGVLRRLQRGYGNQYVGRVIQAKLTVGHSGDVYEQEADWVADAVMRMPEPDISPSALVSHRIQPLRIQRMCTECREEEEEKIHLKESPGQTPRVIPGLEAHLNANSGSGQPLPEGTRSFMESRFGRDFSQVRIHTDADAALMNRELEAQAFTRQRDIYFGAGKYQPDSREGQRLLAHELTHVVQQSGGMNHQPEALPKISSAMSPRISRWEIHVQSGKAISDREDDTLWGLARTLTSNGFFWGLIIPIHMQSPRAGSGEYWRYIWIGDTFDIRSLVTLAGYLPWSPNAMVTFLASQGDQTIIETLLNRGYSIARFETAYFTWLYDDGTQREEEATGLYGATCPDRSYMGCVYAPQILIRTGLLTNEAASTLFHETGHVTSTEPDYLEQEIQVRIDEEEFRIRHRMSPGGPGYRNPDGTVNEAAIRQSVTGSSVYNPTGRRMIAMRYRGRRRTSGWVRLLRLIQP